MTDLENLRKDLKEGEVLGADAEIGKMYISPKGTVVKIDKKKEVNGQLEVFGLVNDKNSGEVVVVKIPNTIVLKIYETVIENKKEESVMKEIKNEKVEKVDKTAKVERQAEAQELYTKMRDWISKNVKDAKLREKSVAFIVDGIKCSLYPDAMVLAKTKISGIEPNTIYKNCVRYHIKDLYDKIGYKE